MSSTHKTPYPKTHEMVKVKQNMTYNVTVLAISEKGEGAALTANYTSGPHDGMSVSLSICKRSLYLKPDESMLAVSILYVCSDTVQMCTCSVYKDGIV